MCNKGHSVLEINFNLYTHAKIADNRVLLIYKDGKRCKKWVNTALLYK
jgi:hypothetical protein